MAFPIPQKYYRIQSSLSINSWMIFFFDFMVFSDFLKTPRLRVGTKILNPPMLTHGKKLNPSFNCKLHWLCTYSPGIARNLKLSLWPSLYANLMKWDLSDKSLCNSKTTAEAGLTLLLKRLRQPNIAPIFSSCYKQMVIIKITFNKHLDIPFHMSKPSSCLVEGNLSKPANKTEFTFTKTNEKMSAILIHFNCKIVYIYLRVKKCFYTSFTEHVFDDVSK